MKFLYRGYRPLIAGALRPRAGPWWGRPLGCWGWPAGCFLRMGGEFIPQLDEGDFAVNVTLAPGSLPEPEHCHHHPGAADSAREISRNRAGGGQNRHVGNSHRPHGHGRLRPDCGAQGPERVDLGRLPRGAGRQDAGRPGRRARASPWSFSSPSRCGSTS